MQSYGVKGIEDLRHLPDAVRRLNAEMLARPKDQQNHRSWTKYQCIKVNLAEDAAYIHCTAGLGRAPATALAYMRPGQRVETASYWLEVQTLFAVCLA